MRAVVADPRFSGEFANPGFPAVTAARVVVDKNERAFVGMDNPRHDHYRRMFAKEFGAKVTSITVSRAQAEYARARVFREGLNEQVEIRLQDYRDVTGGFDRIASIEMFEAVGERFWPTYFGTLRERLLPGGAAGLQLITIADRYFDAYRRNVDFIQAYIFPGGMLPSPAALDREAARAGLARTSEIGFRAGPVFANVVLADEINRAAAKTQSALLEVMEERTVTVDGVPNSVPDPFLVVATQNPVDLDGTYRLPEAQLDRFLMKTSVGYPDRQATVELLNNAAVRDRAALVQPVITAATIAQMSGLADQVYVDPAVIGYVAELAEESRRQPHVKLGLSPRGCLALVRVAKTWAAADGRDHVVPDDVKALATGVLRHRLMLSPAAEIEGRLVEDLVADLVEGTEAPR